MRRLDRASLLVIAAVVLAAGTVLAADLASERGRRLADLDSDLRTAQLLIGAEVLAAHEAVRDLGKDRRARVAALNRRSEYFGEQLARLRAVYPEMRAISADAGYGYLVGAGEPALAALLERVQDSPLCLGGRVYTVMWAPLGNIGVVGIAYDTAPVLARARTATEGRVHLSLMELLTWNALAVHGVDSCTTLPNVAPYPRVLNGDRDLHFIDGEADAAVGYAPLPGTIVTLLVEEDQARVREATLLRRGGVLVVAALVVLAYLAGRAVARREPGA